VVQQIKWISSYEGIYWKWWLSCGFIKSSSNGFSIISVYVDDLHIFGNEGDINEACHHLKTEFEMKDMGRTNFF
jgi:hypothetical protein